MRRRELLVEVRGLGVVSDADRWWQGCLNLIGTGDSGALFAAAFLLLGRKPVDLPALLLAFLFGQFQRDDLSFVQARLDFRKKIIGHAHLHVSFFKGFSLLNINKALDLAGVRIFFGEDGRERDRRDILGRGTESLRSRSFRANPRVRILQHDASGKPFDVILDRGLRGNALDLAIDAQTGHGFNGDFDRFAGFQTAHRPG